MPQSTPERRARWKDDTTAIEFLIARDYKLTNGWCWLLPNPAHEIVEDENDAMCFMIEEWDFGGYLKTLEPGQVIIQQRVDRG